MLELISEVKVGKVKIDELIRVGFLSLLGIFFSKKDGNSFMKYSLNGGLF